MLAGADVSVPPHHKNADHGPSGKLDLSADRRLPSQMHTWWRRWQCFQGLLRLKLLFQLLLYGATSSWMALPPGSHYLSSCLPAWAHRATGRHTAWHLALQCWWSKSVRFRPACTRFHEMVVARCVWGGWERRAGASMQANEAGVQPRLVTAGTPSSLPLSRDGLWQG